MGRILSRELGIGLGVFAALAGAGQAQSRPATASTLQTSSTGAVVTTTNGTAAPGGSTENLVIGGALWTRSNPDWTPKVVSIGAQGTQVFSQIEFGQDHAELLSGFSPDPATPVWTSNVAIAGTNAFCESAETTDAHVTVHQIVQNNQNSTRVAVVSRWRSGSTTPEWTWSFPGVTSGLSRAAISADGTRIVAATLYPMEMRLSLAVFQGSSGTPVYTGDIPSFGIHLRGFELAADGNTLYMSSNSTTRIWNVNTHTTIQQVLLSGMFDGHAISGDGRVFAWGEFNRFHLYERNSSGTYTETYVRTLPGSIICDRLALSANGSTLAIGWHYFDTNLRVRVEALDVASKVMTMSEEAEGTGTFQNIVSAVSVSDDGQRFAVGLWGDEGNIVPEVRLYRRNQNAPVAQYNLPGSVYDLEMSGDGERVAVAWKPVHANTFAGGGGFSLYPFEAMDFGVTGVPGVGDTISIEMSGPANAPARLLWSRGQAAGPCVFNGIGSLHLRRLDMVTVPIGNSDGGGSALTTFTLPSGVNQVGQSLYFQGYFAAPRHLTNDWARVTILP
ncbi:MAG: hypothetical protein NTY35_11385 [Planctomycetota bacterium]|nr:hypothetical protein [Planctomycetota bacterium]